LVNQLQEVAGDLPIVALASTADDQEAASLLAQGVHDVLMEGEMTAPVLARALRYARQRHAAARRRDELRRLLQSVIDALPEPTIVVDRHRRIVLANRAARDTPGQDSVRPGLRPGEAWDGKLYGAWGGLRPLDQVLASEAPVTVTALDTPVGGDDRVAFLDVTGTPIRNEAGHVAQVMLTYRDVTQRKRAEEALANRNRLLAAINELCQKTFTCDDVEELAQCCLGLARRVTASQVGFLCELGGGGDIANLWFTEEAGGQCQVERADVLRALQDRGPSGLVQRLLAQRGPLLSNKPAQWYATSALGKLRNVLVVPIIHEDVAAGIIATGEKDGSYDGADWAALESLARAFFRALAHLRAERALKREREFIETVLETVDSGIVACNAQGVLTLFNRAAREFHGVPQRPVPVERWADEYDLYLPDGQTKMPKEQIPLFRALAGQRVRDVEMMIIPPGGQARWVSASGKPLLDADGQCRGAVMALRDITEQREAEKQLREREGQLRHAQKMEAVGALAGGIAHEFNNLIQVIQGYTRYVMEELEPGNQAYLDLETVLQASQRAQGITSQLLGFSRRQILRRERVAINGIVSEVARMIEPLIGEQITLEVRLADDAGFVDADAGELQQVLLNLCINARDAMLSGGRLMLRTVPEHPGPEFCQRHGIAPGPYATVIVADTGCGISDEVRERIFEPFFTTKEVGQGTGLGLAVVYGLVQQHQGTVEVESELGGGTTFRIYLPRVAAGDAGPTAGAPPSPPRGAETILLAEDDPMVRDLITRTLKDAGYRVLAAADGAEAIRVFEENRAIVSLALLDAVMPRCNGHEVYRRIQAAAPETKVIFLSGYDARTAASNSPAEGTVRLVRKPFQRDALLHAIRSTLDEDGLAEKETCQPVEARA